eukprot:gene9461-6644_t
MEGFEPVDQRPSTSSSRPGSSVHTAGTMVDWEYGRHEVPEEDARALLKGFFEFTRAQALEERELAAECLQLEMEECGLWHQILASDHTTSRSRVSILEPEHEVAEKEGEAFLSASPSGVQEGPDDEFDDAYISNDGCCVYEGGWPLEKAYLYAEPGQPGKCHPVGEVPDLFRVVSSEGVWAYYNDSEQYIMQVKLSFSASSEVAPGPRTKVLEHTPTPSETTYEVTVRPEETEILLFGTAVNATNRTVRLPVTSSFHNPYVAKADQRHMEELNALTALAVASPASGGSSVLDACDPAKAIFFIDPEFPPVYVSICRPNDSEYLWPVPWRRPAEYLSAKDAEDVRLFRGEVKAADPALGAGRNEYLCSAARIVAEAPEWIHWIFRHPVSPEAGREERAKHAFRVTLLYEGWWDTALVDDYLPASKKGPTFGRCEYDLRKIWYPLLEKAYAKMAGSYAAIQRGTVWEAMQLLRGCPVSVVDGAQWEHCRAGTTKADQANRDALFSLLERHLHRGHMVLLTAPETGPSSWRGFSLGLSFGSACVVTRMVQHESLRLLQVRSAALTPLAWDGRWCTESISWKQEPEVAARCHMSQGNYDAVWMEWAEALAMFAGGGACHTGRHGTRFDYRVQGSFDGGEPSVCLKIDVSEPMEAYFILTQRLPRRAEDAALAPIALGIGSVGTNRMATPLWFSSQDPDAPTPASSAELHKGLPKQPALLTASSVAVRCRLEPGHGPYCVIPWTSATWAVPYTIGVLPDTGRGDAMRGSFFALDSPARFFAGDTIPLEDRLEAGVKANCQRREAWVVANEAAPQPVEDSGAPCFGPPMRCIFQRNGRTTSNSVMLKYPERERVGETAAVCANARRLLHLYHDMKPYQLHSTEAQDLARRIHFIPFSLLLNSCAATPLMGTPYPLTDNAAAAQHLQLLPLALVPPPPDAVDRQLCLAGDVIVLSLPAGLQLYRRREGSTVVWEHCGTRCDDCFRHAYACSSMDPFFSSRGAAHASRLYRYVCVTAGNEECGHSVSVTSATSSFAHHHELHGTNPIARCALAPITAVGAAMFHHSPFAASLDEAGHLAIFDIDRSVAQLVMRPGEGAAEAYTLNAPGAGRAALQILLHGPCTSRGCTWCRSPQARGMPLTVHVLHRAEDKQSVVLRQLHVCWTSQRAVLHSDTELYAARVDPTCPSAQCAHSLSLASAGGDALAVQLIAGDVHLFHGCAGLPLPLPLPMRNVVQWLPVGVASLHLPRSSARPPTLEPQEAWDCAVAVTGTGAVLLVGAPPAAAAPEAELWDAKAEMDRWLDEEEGEKAKALSTTSGSRQLPSAPAYTALAELLTPQQYRTAYGGMDLADPPRGRALPRVLFYEPQRRQLYLQCAGGGRVAVCLPLQREAAPPAPRDPLRSAVAAQGKAAFSWGLARSLAGAILRASAPPQLYPEAPRQKPTARQEGVNPWSTPPEPPLPPSQPPHAAVFPPSLDLSLAPSRPPPERRPPGSPARLRQLHCLRRPDLDPDPAAIHRAVVGLAAPRRLVTVLEPMGRDRVEWAWREAHNAAVTRRFAALEEERDGLPLQGSRAANAVFPALEGERTAGLGCASRGFSSAYEALMATPADDAEALSLGCYLCSFREGDAALTAPAPFVRRLQDADRIEYEVQDMVLRQAAELRSLEPHETVIMVEVQERAPSEECGWRQLRYCDVEGRTVDWKRWCADADGAKKGVWVWTTDEAPLYRGRRRTTAVALQGWSLGPWRYAIAWPPGEPLSAVPWVRRPAAAAAASFSVRHRILSRRRAHVERQRLWALRRLQHREEVRLLREELLAAEPAEHPAA